MPRNHEINIPAGIADQAAYGDPDEALAAFWGDADHAPQNVNSESTLPISGDHLMYQDDGSIVHERFRITPTGLDLPDDLDGDEWVRIGRIIKTIESAGMWAAGDWADYANKVWDIPYEKIAAQFDYKASTLKVYASICRNIPRLTRNQHLSFSHHRLVAPLHPSDQRRMLAMAFDDKGRPLTIPEFKNLLIAHNLLEAGEPIPMIDKFTKQLGLFAKQQLKVATQAKSIERRQMAELLRRLADTIEGME